mgnify:CR=1 FL=1
MDPHAQWLRRFLMSRVMARLAVEGVIVAAIAAGVAVAVGAHIGLALLLSLIVTQVFVVARVAGALLANPIDSRYLLGLESTAHRLQPLQRMPRRPCRQPRCWHPPATVHTAR